MTAEAESNDKINVWVHSFCPEILSAQDVGVSIQNSRIRTEQYLPHRGNGPGIVIASEITPHLCEFVSTISKDKLERVIVLLAREAAFLSGNPWQILQAGASDVLVWDYGLDLASVLTAKFQRWQEIDHFVNSTLIRNSLVGQSRAWKSVLRRLVEVARFTDDPVVLIGETGTGKELAARLIHTLDLKRHRRDLVTLDCTTIVPDLSGSELFGHEKGSFTGAVSPREGAFALADGGTLFLDEIGELPLNLQIQLLRVLQEHTYKRVGSNQWIKTDFRLICATNQELRSQTDLGQFRRDLYYRIAHWVIHMPPLCERMEDILSLVEHFMRQARPGQEPPEVDSKVQEYLLTREYPGNVRDLRSLVLRIMARHLGGGPITIGEIPSDERPVDEIDQRFQYDLHIEQSIRRAVACGLGLKEIKRLVEDTTIRVVLDDQAGNLQQAARVLDVTDRTLQKHRADQLRALESSVNR